MHRIFPPPLSRLASPAGVRLGLILLSLATATASGTAVAPLWRFDSGLQFRAGVDTNPDGTSGTSAAVLGAASTATYAAGLNLGLTLAAATPDRSALKFVYAGEAVRFDRWSGEDFATHRLSFTGRFATGRWKFSGEGSTLFVAGPDETLRSVPSVNANAIALWRERRRQWQHRLKLQAQADLGLWVVRGTGTLLAYDYLTAVKAGQVALANRSDLQGALDLGWKQNPGSLWLAGVRAGHQQQAAIALPNCGYDYSNDYTRLAAGWEGKPCANTTVTFAAGPDFRHYTGTIDRTVFLGGRDRTSLWVEGAFLAKLSPVLTLTGKVVRMDWLSSTGKSAYLDTCGDTALAWTPDPAWTVRLTARLHRCDYFPLVRDDWESLAGAGAGWKLSPRTEVTLDVLRHRGWNNLAAYSEREFHRVVVSLGAVTRF